MNLPNKLTMLRMILIPFFIAFIFLDSVSGLNAFNDFIACAIFLGASVTDYFDGQIARKRNMVTDFGKLFDPAADKLLCGSALICLVFRYVRLSPFIGEVFPVLITVFVIVIICREMFITAFRSMAASKNIVMAADMPGKIKTVAQMCAITGLVLALDFLLVNDVVFNVFFYAGFSLLAVGTLMAVLSCVLYLVKYKAVFADAAGKAQ